jgi:hypothetical protein
MGGFVFCWWNWDSGGLIGLRLSISLTHPPQVSFDVEFVTNLLLADQ